MKRDRFVRAQRTIIAPSKLLVEAMIPDTTPGTISRYALSGTQTLLAKIRYNRLVDIFSGLVCYSLQTHLRTTIPNIGRIDTDEVYIGVDQRGAHYVLPIQAKRAKDRINVIQTENDFAVCTKRFPSLPCRVIAAQSISDERIAMFQLEQTKNGIRVSDEKHYRLVSPDELKAYRERPL